MCSSDREYVFGRCYCYDCVSTPPVEQLPASESGEMAWMKHGNAMPPTNKATSVNPALQPSPLSTVPSASPSRISQSTFEYSSKRSSVVDSQFQRGASRKTMASTAIRSPLDFTSSFEMARPVSDRDGRVQDFIADKLQTNADFKDIDSLIAKVEESKRLLDVQNQDARKKISEHKQKVANTRPLRREQNAEFQRKYESVKQRLMIITSSTSPEIAIEKMKGPMEMLRRVELAESYVELLKDVGDLKKEARACLPDNPKGALLSYTRMKELAIMLADLQEPTEGAAGHLVNHVQKTTDDLWKEMKRILTDEFEAVLKRSNWPENQAEVTTEWSDCFTKLLDLQTPELTDTRQPVILLPIAVLSKTFVAQFRYHFFSDKPTNDPHQLGNYFFDWFVGTIAKWEEFLREKIAPVLAAHFKGNIVLAGNPLYVDPVAAFITALLPIMKGKVESVMTQISKEPQYVSRFIPQLMTFDEKLRTQFGYDAGNLEYGWKGLTWDLLEVWFPVWFNIEKDFAWKRYREIIDDLENQEIDRESEGSKTSATFASLQIRDLLVYVTQQYKGVRRFQYKVKFLIDIQAEILDDYVKSLRESLDIYVQMKTIGRAMFSRQDLDKTKGINGLKRLCRVYCSADHLTTLCKEWSNEEFFIVLWDELQDRAKHTDRNTKLTGDMSLSEVKDVTSNAVDTDDMGSVFDFTIEHLSEVRRRAEELIIKHAAGMRVGLRLEAEYLLNDVLSLSASRSLRRKFTQAVSEQGGYEEEEEEEEEEVGEEDYVGGEGVDGRVAEVEMKE